MLEHEKDIQEINITEIPDEETKARKMMEIKTNQLIVHKYLESIYEVLSTLQFVGIQQGTLSFTNSTVYLLCTKDFSRHWGKAHGQNRSKLRILLMLTLYQGKTEFLQMLIYLMNTAQKELVDKNEEKWEHITQSGLESGCRGRKDGIWRKG